MTRSKSALAACSAASLSVDRASPQPPGTTLKLTGGASCPSTPEYRFWVGQNGLWSLVQDYSASNSYSWNTTGKAQATYGLEVDVRNHGSAIGYDRVANLTYQLATPPCAAPSFGASPATQAGTGAHVTLTASTSGCPTPQYRFWISPPGQLWSIVQDYSATNTYAWTTTGAAGTYRLEVDVRDQTSSVSYEKAANITYTRAGENLAYAQSVAIAHRALMDSSGHRENILRPEFTRIGIGIINAGAYGRMVTQLFITP